MKKAVIAMMVLVASALAQTNLGPIKTTTTDDVGQATAPPHPPSGQCRRYFNTTTGQETWINSSGASCGPSGGSSSVTLGQGNPAAGNNLLAAVNSPVYMDASQFPELTSSGAVDVCKQAQDAENQYVVSSGAAGQIIVPVPNKAYCSVLPQITSFAGDVYFVGLNSRAIIYTGVSWTGLKSGIHIHGTGPAGVSTNVSNNVRLMACNENLHDNLYPGTASSAPCAGFYDSTTNMPQATISAVSVASGGSATVTLSSALSGSLPNKFAGRLLCLPKSITLNAADQACFVINAEPTSGGTVFTVNSTTMVACAATCGTAKLETPLLNLNSNFFGRVTDMVLDCGYVYACATAVNGVGEEGTMLGNVQLFNATVYYYRKFVGSNISNGAYGNGCCNGGASHAGPDIGIWGNYQSVTCENNTQGGCYGTDGTHSTAGFLEAVGTVMACGDRTKLAAGQAILASSSTVAASPCQKNFAGLVLDGIAMGTNSFSTYGIMASTMSGKDVFNTGSHVAMPEETNSVGLVVMGPSSNVYSLHEEYWATCAEIGGNAARNETWVSDGSTKLQSFNWYGGDINNCNNPAGSLGTQEIDLGTANGTSNAMNLHIFGVSTVNGSKFLKNNLQSNADCTVTTETSLTYIFAQNSGVTPLLLASCTTASSQIPSLEGISVLGSQGGAGGTGFLMFGTGVWTQNTLSRFDSSGDVVNSFCQDSGAIMSCSDVNGIQGTQFSTTGPGTGAIGYTQGNPLTSCNGGVDTLFGDNVSGLLANCTNVGGISTNNYVAQSPNPGYYETLSTSASIGATALQTAAPSPSWWTLKVNVYQVSCVGAAGNVVVKAAYTDLVGLEQPTVTTLTFVPGSSAAASGHFSFKVGSSSNISIQTTYTGCATSSAYSINAWLVRDR